MKKEKIETLLKKKSKKIFPQKEIGFFLETPKEREFGDYSSNFPLRAAKQLKKSPQEIASFFIKEIEKDKNLNHLFEKVYFLNGFLNFFLSREILLERLKFFFQKKKKERKREKIILEFISANPTGELTLGNARGGFLGDALFRLLKSEGWNVFSEYYVNDAKNSLQIQELGKTFLGKGKSYLSEYLSSLLKKIKPKKKFKDEKEAGYFLAQIIQKENERFIKEKLKIHFDNFFSEESLYQKGEIKKLVSLMRRKNLLYRREGAVYLKTKEWGDEKDRVVIRSNGLPTYFLSDIAYHLTKIKRGFGTMIDIWGADHWGHQKRMFSALRSLGYLKKEKLKIVIVQMVSLKKEGERRKMSKRRGEYLSLRELIEEVGLDAARFFFLRRAPESHLDFDLSLAKEKSQKNPLYYLQYVWVRMNGILKKAPKKGKIDFSSLSFEKEEEVNLLREIVRFEEIKKESAENLAVHQLISWLIFLASLFHRFYEKCPVLVSEKKIRNSRLALLRGVKKIFQETFEILGISLPEKM